MSERGLAVPFYTLGDLQMDLGDLMESIKKGFGSPSWFAEELRDIANALMVGQEEGDND